MASPVCLWARASAARFVGIWASVWGAFVLGPRLVQDWSEPVSFLLFETAFWLVGGALLGWFMWKHEVPRQGAMPPESAS